ncbi:MAG: serpin family protein [Bacteroidota bacterium]|nr:serpin family protein [Bacteroidota bacterium]
MKTSLLFILILMLVTFSCKKAEPISEEPANLLEKSAELIEADNSFGLDLFSRVVAKAEKNTNTSVSPLSVSLALAMTYNGASGETKIEMENAMKFSGITTAQINHSHQALVAALKSSDPEVVLEIANAIYYQQGFKVEPNFISTNREFYDSEINSLNFGLPVDALKIINGWVALKTHDKIPIILEKIDGGMTMVLLNAVYFNGIWKSKFKDKETHNQPFYLSDGTYMKTPMMKQETALEYASGELFSAVNLPYGKGQFQMTVILPNRNKTTKDVISALNTENWRLWMKSFKNENQVVVTMPRFKFSWNLELNEALIEMGMKQAFLPGSANFTGISKAGNLFISSVIHKTYIDVNENGTEAAAVTAVIMTTGESGPDVRKHFYVDRPFLFAITEKTSGAILFIGEITNPQYPI